MYWGEDAKGEQVAHYFSPTVIVEVILSSDV